MQKDASADALISLRRRSFSEIAPHFEGALAIFIEKPTATCVRVHDISLNDWGVTLQITREGLPGTSFLNDRQLSSTQIGAGWEFFSGDRLEWSAAYVSWRLLFDQKVIDLFIELARDAADQGETLTCRAAQGRMLL